MIREIVRPTNTIDLADVREIKKGIFAYYTKNGSEKGCVCILFAGHNSCYSFKYLNTPSSRGGYQGFTMEQAIEKAIEGNQKVFHFETANEFITWASKYV